MTDKLAVIDAMQDAVLAPVVEAVAADERIARAVDAATYAMSVVVDSPQAAAEAEAAIVHITQGRKALEAHRKPVTKAIDGLKAAVMDYVKSLDGPFNAADLYLANQLTKWRSKVSAQREQAAQEQAKALAAAAAAGAPPPIVRSAPATTAPSMAPEGTGVGDKWDIVIEMERPYEVPESLLALAPGAKAWIQSRMAAGEIDLAQKDEATTLFRGIRVTWKRGIRRSA